MQVKPVLPLLTAAFAVLLLASPAAATSWHPIVTLAKQGVPVGGRSMAVAGSNAHVVYLTSVGVSYRHSSNGGASWARPIVLAKPTQTSHPSQGIVAASGSRVFVVWWNYTGSGEQLWLRRSVDGGSSFRKRQLVTSGPTNSIGPISLSRAMPASQAWVRPQ